MPLLASLRATIAMYAIFLTKSSIVQYPRSHVWVKVSLKGEGLGGGGVKCIMQLSSEARLVLTKNRACTEANRWVRARCTISLLLVPVLGAA